jgi:hypothetical protein
MNIGSRTLGIIAATSLALGMTMAAAPLAQAKSKFTSCEEMHRVYTNGISKSASAANLAVRTGSRRPIVAPRAYRNSSPSLDSDKDGTMCEVQR